MPVTFGYDGAYTANISGMQDSFFGRSTIFASDVNHAWTVMMPANTHFRAALFDEDTTNPGSEDLDLSVFRTTTCATGHFALMGSSGGATTEEVVDIPNGPVGCYWVVVDYFGTVSGSSSYKAWFQPVFGDNVNTTVIFPAAAASETDATVTVDYTGLAPTRTLSVLHHNDGRGELGRTILDIDARP